MISFSRNWSPNVNTTTTVALSNYAGKKSLFTGTFIAVYNTRVVKCGQVLVVVGLGKLGLYL